MSHGARTPGWVIWIALAVAMVPILDACMLAREMPAQVDDAYISYRYAENLVQGQGLVWNPGERVEGFTNPLWTLMIAGGLGLGFEAPRLGYAFGMVSGLALLLGTALLARRYLELESRWLAPFAPAILAAFGGFTFWSTAGMETSFHAALAMGALLAASHGRRGWMVGLLVALVWTRMDGALLAAVLLANDARHRRRPLDLGWPSLVFGLGIAFGLALRLAYYGTWLPNTYFAKVGGTPIWYGAAYLGEFLASGAVLLLPAAAFAVWRVPSVRPAVVWIALHTLYVVRVGGDAFAFSRFLLCVLAPLCAVAVAGLGRSLASRPFVAWALAPTLALAAIYAVFDRIPLGALVLGVPPWLAWEWARLRPDGDVAARRVSIGAPIAGLALWLLLSGGPSGLLEARNEAHRNRRLAEEWRFADRMQALQRRRAEKLLAGTPPSLVATGAIGSLGFYTRLPVLDILGLTDPHIANAVVTDTERGVAMPGHARSDADYVLGRHPDLLVIPRANEGPVWIFALQDLWAHPDLERLYHWDEDLKAYRLDPGSDPGD